MPSEGHIEYRLDGHSLDPQEVYTHLSMAAPYMELFENLSLNESVDMHGRFKKWTDGLSSSDIPALLGLEGHAHKSLNEFSSGMKQRVKLGLAILSKVSLTLLDEPTSNLDKAGRKWYRDLVDGYGKEKTLVVCSNHQEEEYDFCDKIMDLAQQA